MWQAPACCGFVEIGIVNSSLHGKRRVVWNRTELKNLRLGAALVSWAIQSAKICGLRGCMARGKKRRVRTAGDPWRRRHVVVWVWEGKGKGEGEGEGS